MESRFSPENLPHNLQLIELLKTWAKRKQVTPGQIALAWLFVQSRRLEENLGAVDVELTADDFRQIENITSRVEVKGARYSEGSQKLVNR